MGATSQQARHRSAHRRCCPQTAHQPDDEQSGDRAGPGGQQRAEGKGNEDQHQRNEDASAERDPQQPAARPDACAGPLGKPQPESSNWHEQQSHPPEYPGHPRKRFRQGVVAARKERQERGRYDGCHDKKCSNNMCHSHLTPPNASAARSFTLHRDIVAARQLQALGGALREHPAFDQLLVNLAIVPDPARRVTFARVAVCPVNHAPFGVPFVLAAERHNIAFAKADDSRSQIDVVRDEKRLPRGERHDEALMPAAVIVVREHPTNDALPFHL